MTDIAPIPTVDLVETLISTMRESEADHAEAQARALLEAATKILQERFGVSVAIRALGTLAAAVQAQGKIAPLSAEAPTSVRQDAMGATDHAFAVLDMLRAMPRDVAHERARAAVAGTGAYLYETFGDSYASAVLGETIQMAADHGAIMRGGRASGVALH